jgi:bifunctional DNA-binding transcriptional regulator/antitoxin component of YhaV-PrlF toxin-antitoxin module
MTNLTNIKRGDKITFKVTDFRNDTFKIVTRKVQDVVIHHTGRIQGYNVRPIGSGVQCDQINSQDIIEVK